MKISLAVICLMSAAAPLPAVIIDNPLSLQTQFLAGIHNGDAANSNPTTEAAIAQAILDLGAGQTVGPLQTNTLFDYNGTITLIGPQIDSGFDDADDSISIPAGWGGALAKYDGQNAGYALFVFGGTASTIPEYPWNLWTTNPEQYQISHYTLLRGSGNLTPTPQSTVPEGGVSMALFGLALAGMGLLRARLARRATA